ncbi:MAG: hypothetical protein C4542_01360 [Dehalococcoidia bacterium]|nr:MAG: hypothetical protein C4542_01360 [Dehalococcoidia bacterium]
MSETLGKMEKPEASQFKNGRKLFFVPLVFKPMEEDAALSELTAKYWGEVESHLANLESKLSDIKKIYHELLPGEDGVKQLENLSIGSHRIVEALMGKGATLTEVEDSDILGEFMEWGRCLSLDLRSPVVFAKVFEAYQEAQRKRNEHIARRIDETLQADESAVLFMREGHHVQFPADIQVFYVAPPSLDAIQRALRERQEKTYREEASRARNEAEKTGGKPQTEDDNPEEGKA